MDETQFNDTNLVLLKEGKISEFNQQRKKYPNLKINLAGVNLQIRIFFSLLIKF